MSDVPSSYDQSPPRPWSPIPGPSDRVTFFKEQRRHRRATWRALALYGLAVAVMGISVSTVLSPLVGLLALLCTRLAGLVVPVPDGVWEAFRAFVAIFDHLVSTIQARRFSIEQMVPNMLGLGILMLPGALAIILLLAFWGTIWGIVGMFLSVPIMMLIMIVCANVPSWRWVAILLSKDGRINAQPSSRITRRSCSSISRPAGSPRNSLRS